MASPAPTGTQSRVLVALAKRDSPTTLAELAQITGRHENTLRGHLAALHRTGQVSRLRAVPSGRGRPAWSYAALARAAARGLESNPGATARETGESGGRAWGVQLRELFEKDDQTPLERFVLVLAHVGFGPRISANHTAVRLTRKPFAEPDACLVTIAASEAPE